MDMIGEVDNFPKPNSTQEANDFRTACGGKGANEAVACGKLDTRCYVVGRVGSDDFGRTMTKRLAEWVNVDGIAIDKEVGTGFALIVTASDTQHKTNTICKGANEFVAPAPFVARLCGSRAT
jgi:ribokinase